MKKLAIIMIFFVMMTSISYNAFAVDSLGIRLMIKDDVGNEFNTLIFGIHKDATDNLDIALGELDLPPTPLPTEISAFLFIVDSSISYKYWTPVDFRPIPEQLKFVKYYNFRVYAGVEFTISWPKFDSFADSAFLRDVITGNLVNINMMETNSHYVSNIFQDKYDIVIYYNLSLTGINENTKMNVCDNISIFPNPVVDNLTIEGCKEKYSYKIINSLGREMLNGEINDNKSLLDIKALERGLYFVYLNSNSGKTRMLKFIKY